MHTFYTHAYTQIDIMTDIKVLPFNGRWFIGVTTFDANDMSSLIEEAQKLMPNKMMLAPFKLYQHAFDAHQTRIRAHFHLQILTAKTD